VRIGELADAAGVPTRTIRFYERRGLLADPRRAPNGYRVYGAATLDRLRFIRTAQAAGLTLAEVRSITDIRDDGITPCTHVEALLETKLAELEHELEHLVERSHHLDPADCHDRDVCHILSASERGPSELGG
jgi:DNA-binding transcriptional MerR regulator